ncbi:uncharacterized protein Dana_GF22041 [Drosophila ananassae]|uniref:Uncharacterized protein n=1 Tax=Drosophila ananassae TaxID=7217 RepID=B3MYE5_DROAN|nr:uncharacterized protein Dana_GF22041 [Drosophila ananassae]
MIAEALEFLFDRLPYESEEDICDMPESLLVLACVLGVLIFVTYILIRTDADIYPLYPEVHPDDEELIDDLARGLNQNLNNWLINGRGLAPNDRNLQ